jgi:VIT1/CCC1 family predicted Fe2+/Mn2+ transporter
MDTRWFPNEAYFRNFIFGVEDSLVSTVGLIAGVAAAGVERTTILVTGVILIFVEAFSMGVGSFLSESSAEEYQGSSNRQKSARSAGIMFVSYFIAGFVPIGPYVFLPQRFAFWTSIALSIAALFALGIASARVSKSSLLKTSLRMALLGGLAIAIGVSIGAAFKAVI